MELGRRVYFPLRDLMNPPKSHFRSARVSGRVENEGAVQAGSCSSCTRGESVVLHSMLGAEVRLFSIDSRLV